MARASYLGSARAMALCAPASGRLLHRPVVGFVAAVDNHAHSEGLVRAAFHTCKATAKIAIEAGSCPRLLRSTTPL
jgi:hypothetical protein